MKKRVLFLLLAAVLLLGLMPAALAANPGGAQGVVDAAKGYLEQNYAVGSYFGGGDTNWCGRFLYRCAEDAGETAALCGSVDTLKSTLRAMSWFVKNGESVGYFYSTIKISDYGLNTDLLMDKANYSPKVGDIIFYDWDGSPTGFDHMEIVSSVSGRTITAIGGSTGSSCTQKNWGGKYHVHAHTYDISSKYIVAYARPAYGTAPLAANTSYKSWAQGDPRWGSNTTSSSGTGYSMASVGCLVTAIAKILVHSGQQDQTMFTPEECRQALLDTEMLSASGGILPRNYNNAFLPTYAPELTHEYSNSHSAWSKSSAISTISDKITDNYYVIVCVNNKSTGNTHWMAVDYVGDDIYVMDNGGVVPLYGTSKYSGGVVDQVYFKYSGSKSYPAIDSTTTIVPLSINTTTKPTANMKEGSPFYFRGSITSGSSITSATVSILGANGTTVVQTKTVYPNATSVDILKGGLDDLKFGKLAVGGYYLYLTATDASGQTAEWKEPFSIGNAPLPNPTTATKTQYRYHRYIDAKGNVSLCPYYGGSLFKSTMTLQYTDWLDAPLTKNSSSSGHNHVNQGSLCTKAGCIDPSGKTERFTDGSSNWYYQETRVVAVEPTSTPTPTPTPMPESSKLPLSFIKTYPSGMYWDVSSDDWFYSNVVDAYELGLMVGLNATTFAPNDNVTVAQAITMAARIHSLYHTGSMGFPVYDGGNWYDPYVDYALTNGLVARGDLLDRFLSMDRAATREEFVYILARALPESELQPIADISFTDEESIYYRTSVRLLSRAGIINGYTQYGLSYFDPTGYITRAQAAAIIGRMSRPGTRVGG